MNILFLGFISDLEFGEVKQSGSLSAIPLFYKTPQITKYLTLREALERQLLKIAEINQGGSVPELMVANSSDMPVLLLDGEELCGAKQNRVLNTTVLIKAKSETVIPVSCTEHGRWSYKSQTFADSDVVMGAGVRTTKLESVSRSLEMGRHYRSEQGAVWDGISALHSNLKTSSSTGAMKDAFESKKADINKYTETIRPLPGQRGIICIIGDRVAGMDVISSDTAYQALHSKLVGSYAIDSLVAKDDAAADAVMESAKEFLKDATLCDESRHESVGHGWDCRFRSDKVIGSSLLFNDEVIHMALFRTRGEAKDEHFASFSQRRRHPIQ